MWTMLLFTIVLSVIAFQEGPWFPVVQKSLFEILPTVQYSLTSMTAPVSSLLALTQMVQVLETENRRLQETVGQLTAEVTRLKEIEIEKKQLEEELGYKTANTDMETIAARIIGWDPTNIIQSMIIDKGNSQGVEEGMVVITPQGLVGKIVKIQGTSAKVLLITDPRSTVNAMIQRSDSRAFGVVSGLPKDGLLMRYLSPEERIRIQDMVITSGIGGGFPPGVVVGRVTEVRRNDIEMFQEARLQPLVDFSKLERVLVITNFFPQQIEP